MKKIILASVALGVASGAAMASDYSYTETETVVVVERLDVGAPCDRCEKRYLSSRDVRPNVRPCQARVAEPVRVKTHTEVVDHYQVYQPVTVYQPMGTYTHRYVVPAKKCGGCGA